MSEVVTKSAYNSEDWWADIMEQYRITKLELYGDPDDISRGILPPQLDVKEREMLHNRLIKLSNMMISY